MRRRGDSRGSGRSTRTTRRWCYSVRSGLVGGAAGVDATRGHLEDADGAAAHAVAAPAEDDRVDTPGQNSPQQHLALLLVERPAQNEVHQAGRLYPRFRLQNKAIAVKKL